MTIGPRLEVEPFQTSDSSKTGYAVIDPATGNFAIDYTLYYERIATALETIATLASSTGIKTDPAYGWLLAASSYKIYVDDAGAIGLTALTNYKSRLEDLPKF